jgi:hypothetical protein
MFPPLSLFLSIFVTYPKENDFFFFLKNLGMLGVRMQKYPRSMSIQKVSSTGTAPFLEYPCLIDAILVHEMYKEKHPSPQKPMCVCMYIYIYIYMRERYILNWLPTLLTKP